MPVPCDAGAVLAIPYDQTSVRPPAFPATPPLTSGVEEERKAANGDVQTREFFLEAHCSHCSTKPAEPPKLGFGGFVEQCAILVREERSERVKPLQ